ncbi:MAG: hypothetical protein AAGI24_03900 [Pseudomonadota bacterium]
MHKELSKLPEDHWAIERVRVGLASTPKPRMVWKPSTNIPEVVPIGSDKPTKAMKSYLRAKAEGRLQTIGGAIYEINAEEDSDT